MARELKALVKKPTVELEGDDVDELELGAQAFFDSLERMRKPGCDNWHSTANVNCTRADDSLFACRADIEGVPDLSGGIGGFLIFLTESAEEHRMATQMREAREHVTRLQNQLVPSDVQGFIRDGRTDFAFQTKTVCVVAVQIATFAAHLRQLGTVPFLEQVRLLWAKLGNLCTLYPPVMRQAELSDTYIAVAGLFSADDPRGMASAGVQFAKAVLSEVQNEGDDIRVLIGITLGGPLLCGLTGAIEHTFVASGPAIEDAVALAEFSAPNRILVSPLAREAMPDVEFDTGGDAINGYFLRVAGLEAQKKADASSFSSQLSLPMVDDALKLELGMDF